jgi:hypothetical protein
MLGPTKIFKENIMATVMVEMDSETVDRMVLAQLANSLEGLEEDLKIANRPAIFSSNLEEDNKMIRTHIQAFRMVMSFLSNERYTMQIMANARKQENEKVSEEFDWMHPPGMRR